jgi:hypothetical protein
MKLVFVILLFCIVLGNIINGGWIREQISVDEDATELSRLFNELWSLKPDVFYEEGPFVICQFIDQCCKKEEDRSRAISALIDWFKSAIPSDDSVNKIINECVNTTDLKESIESCPPIRHILYPVITEKDHSNFIDYERIFINNTLGTGKSTNNEDRLCNKEELHALLCSSDTKLVKNCFRKELQNFYDKNGYESYRESVIELKQKFTTAYQQLFQLEMKQMHKQMKPLLRVLSKYYLKQH